MRTSPVNFILNLSKQELRGIYFISGNETSLMQAIKEQLVNSFVERDNNEVSRLQNLTNYSAEKSLFFKKKLICFDETKGLTEDIILYGKLIS